MKWAVCWGLLFIFLLHNIIPTYQILYTLYKLVKPNRQLQNANCAVCQVFSYHAHDNQCLLQIKRSLIKKQCAFKFVISRSSQTTTHFSELRDGIYTDSCTFDSGYHRSLRRSFGSQESLKHRRTSGGKHLG